jgi:hypothetical protein
MTKLLEEAITRVRAEPPEAQDMLAQLVIDVLEDEKEWDAMFGKPASEVLLEQLATEALDEHRRRETSNHDPANRPE